MSEESSNEAIERAKINQETAQISWLELQRYFAQGKVVFVSRALDLVDAAYELQRDNAAQFQTWMADNHIATVSESQALEWYENQQLLWAVVVAPWVLVQLPE